MTNVLLCSDFQRNWITKGGIQPWNFLENILLASGGLQKQRRNNLIQLDATLWHWTRSAEHVVVILGTITLGSCDALASWRVTNLARSSAARSKRQVQVWLVEGVQVSLRFDMLLIGGRVCSEENRRVEENPLENLGTEVSLCFGFYGPLFKMRTLERTVERRWYRYILICFRIVLGIKELYMPTIFFVWLWLLRHSKFKPPPLVTIFRQTLNMWAIQKNKVI